MPEPQKLIILGDIEDAAMIISNRCILPEGWTVDTLMEPHDSVPYNPDIANVFYRAGFIENWGRGIETICSACKVLETPGHTADHIALLAGDVLFCGDAAMNGFPSRRRTTIWIENLPQYQRSWEKILKKNPAVLYPAHGKPFKTKDLRKYLKALGSVKRYTLGNRR